MSPKKKSNPKTALAATFLASRARSRIVLEVEVATTQHSRLAALYGSWIGQKVSWAQLNASGHAHDMKSGKWGSEYRIYFDADVFTKHQLERYGFMVESGARWIPNTYRINSQELFKELVQGHGLRLGENN